MIKITGECGHTVDFDAAWIGKDRFLCPVCRLEWHVEQDAPEVMDSGFVMPGERRVVIDGHRCEESERLARGRVAFETACKIAS